MITKVRVMQCGCGPIGRGVVRFACQRPDVEIVGAIDIDKDVVLWTVPLFPDNVFCHGHPYYFPTDTYVPPSMIMG